MYTEISTKCPIDCKERDDRININNDGNNLVSVESSLWAKEDKGKAKIIKAKIVRKTAERKNSHLFGRCVSRK